MNEENLNNNKQVFNSILRSIVRDNANIEGLIEWLENSDFYVAPASTNKHGAYRGGLVAEALKRFENLTNMSAILLMPNSYNIESLKIVGLLCDISHSNYFKEDFRNVKVYDDALGNKQDDGGKFYWKAEKCYSVIPAEDRFVYSDHGSNSEFMIRHFIPLSMEESVAIIHHHGMAADDKCTNVVSSVYPKYKLATLLNMADIATVFLGEETIEENN